MQIQERSPSRRPPSGLSTVRQPALWLACFLVVLLGLLLGGAERVRLLGQDGALGLAVAASAVLVVATLALAGLGTTVSAGRRWLAWSAALLAAALLALGVAPLWPGLALAAGFLLLMRVCRRQLSEPTLTQLSGWLFMTPALVLMLLWVYFPALYALWISLYTDFDYLGAASFVGLENYRIAFTDPLFLRSLVNTGWYVLGT
ncbi:MAG TPA: hypothetical protein VF171_05010, partial [Trueperaceae bacterium]